MHVVKIRIALLKIMLEFVHVNQEPLETHFWAVFHFNIVQPIANVHLVRFAKLEFVRLFVHRIVNVSEINYACKEFVNRLATTIQLVLNSNFVKIIFAHKRFVAEATMIVCSTKNVKLIQLVVRNVETLVKDVFCAVEMRNVRHEITMVCVHVNKVLSMMAKVVADESNARMIMNVVRIHSVIKIYVNWRAKAEEHAVTRPFVQLKITDPFAIVNQDTVETHMSNVMRSTIAVTLHADQELCVLTIRALSIVLAVTAMLEIHTMKDVVWLSNVQAILTAQ